MISRYVTSLMKDERNDFPGSVVKCILWVVSVGYLVAVKIIGACYSLGIRRKHKVPATVISIGNITLGGTGKTPFTIFTAEYLRSAGMVPAVLTRGYGRDENIMLKEEAPGIPVFVGQDRVKSALSACSGGSNVIVLDDGFQHRRLSRDMDIVLIDSTSFPGNKALFPRGVLREPLSALKRSSLLVLTKVDMIGEADERHIREYLERIAPGVPVASAAHRPVSFSDAAGDVKALNVVRGKRTAVFSGIGDPGYFCSIIRSLGAEIVLRRDYPDHYAYNRSDIEKVFSDSRKIGIEYIITTKKDLVKIRELDITDMRNDLIVLNIATEIIRGKEFLVAGFNSIGIGTRN